MNEKPYIISEDKKGGFWYCHARGYSYIPVFGSIGDKRHAPKVEEKLKEKEKEKPADSGKVMEVKKAIEMLKSILDVSATATCRISEIKF